MGQPHSLAFWLALAQIAAIVILLSADNAAVITLASRSLPPARRRVALLAGVIGAIVLRVAFCLAAALVLAAPFASLAGGVLLLWIAVRMMAPEDDRHVARLAARPGLAGAVLAIGMADIVTSLGSAVAIVAIAGGEPVQIVLGLLVSVPAVAFGGRVVPRLMARLPWLVACGAGLLGWVAGAVIARDAALAGVFPAAPGIRDTAARLVCAVLAMALGGLLVLRAARRPREIVDLAPIDRQ